MPSTTNRKACRAVPPDQRVALLGEAGEQVAGDHQHAEQQHAFVDEAGQAPPQAGRRQSAAPSLEHRSSAAAASSGADAAAAACRALRPALRQQGRLVDEARRRRDLRQPGLLMRRRRWPLGDQRGRRTRLGLDHRRRDRPGRRGVARGSARCSTWPGLRHAGPMPPCGPARRCARRVAAVGRRGARGQLALAARARAPGRPPSWAWRSCGATCCGFLEVQTRLAALVRRQLRPTRPCGPERAAAPRAAWRKRAAISSHFCLRVGVDASPVALQRLERRALGRGRGPASAGRSRLRCATGGGLRRADGPVHERSARSAEAHSDNRGRDGGEARRCARGRCQGVTAAPSVARGLEELDETRRRCRPRAAGRRPAMRRRSRQRRRSAPACAGAGSASGRRPGPRSGKHRRRA